MIRRAKPSDVPALVALAHRALQHVDIGNVVVSKTRISGASCRLVSDPQSLVLVHESDGTIDGAIAVGVSDALWFERKVAGILFWYAEQPRTGYAMLRQAVQWSLSRPVIKAIGLSEEFTFDPRIGKLLERAGLKRRGSVFARY